MEEITIVFSRYSIQIGMSEAVNVAVHKRMLNVQQAPFSHRNSAGNSSILNG